MIMNFQSRKAVDIWLNKLSLYRLNIAVDETSFFRSIAEQTFTTQNHHEKLRELFIDHLIYVKAHLFPDGELTTYVTKIRNHGGVYGEFEMDILSGILRCDFVLYNGLNFSVKQITNYGYSRLVNLCLMKQNHYDAVFDKNHIDNVAFCQSIIYKILFEDIYGFDNVDEISGKMLTKNVSFEEKGDELFAPFPYRVAKALNPALYRNVEFDIWHQERKAIRNQDWYTGGEDLVVGTQCLVDYQGQQMMCYVQKITTDQNGSTYKVYVCNLARLEEVTRSALHPLPNAKPWATPLHLKADIGANVKEYIKIQDYLGCPLYPPTKNNNDFDDINIGLMSSTNSITATTVDAYGKTTISKFLYAKFGDFDVADYQRNIICARGETNFGGTKEEPSPEREREPLIPEYTPQEEPTYSVQAVDLAGPTPPFSASGSSTSTIVAQMEDQDNVPILENHEPVIFPNHSVWINIPVLLNAQYCMYPPTDGEDYSARNYVSSCYGHVTTYPPQCLGVTPYPTYEEEENILDLRINSEEYNPEEGLAEVPSNALALPGPTSDPSGNNYNYGPTPSCPVPVRGQIPPVVYNTLPIYQPHEPSKFLVPNTSNSNGQINNPMPPHSMLNYPPLNIPPPMYPPYYPQYYPQNPFVQYPCTPYVAPSTTATRPPSTINNPSTTGSKTYSTITNTCSYSNSGQDNRDSRQMSTSATTVEVSNSAFSSSSTTSSSGLFTPYNPTLPVPPPCPMPFGTPLQQQHPPAPKNTSKPYYPPGNNNNVSPRLTPPPLPPQSPNNKPLYPSTTSGNLNNSGGSLTNQWYNASGDNFRQKQYTPRYNNPQTTMPPRYQWDGKTAGRSQNRGGYNPRFRRYGNRQPFFPPSTVMEEPIAIIPPTGIVVPATDKKKKEHTIKQILEDESTSSEDRDTTAVSTPPTDTATPSSEVTKPRIDDSSTREINPVEPATIGSPIINVETTEETNTAPEIARSIPDICAVGNNAAQRNEDSVTPATIPTVSIAPPEPAPESNAASTVRDNNSRNFGNNNWHNRGRKKKYHHKGNHNYND